MKLHQRRLIAVCVLAGAAAIAAGAAPLAGCAGSQSNGIGGDDGQVDSGPADGNVDGGSDAPDAPFMLDGTPGPSTPCACSADLHDIVDCDGNSVETCPADQACAGTKCVPACDAAAASKSSIGCDYWVHNARFLDGAGCEALFIANTWSTPAKVSADVKGTTIDLATYAYLPSGTGPGLKLTPIGAGGTIPPGKVGIVFLRDGGVSYTCPKGVSVLESDPAAADWTDPWTGYSSSSDAHALRVYTSVPIVAYDMLPFGGGHGQLTDASLLMPTSSWDTSYIAVTPITDGSDIPSISIIASADATTVTVNPTVDLQGNLPVPAVSAGTPQDFMLAKGQVLRLAGATMNPAGSIIGSDKPIGVWTESPCFNIDGNGCDGAHEQLAPIHALGNEYVYARYRNRVDGQDETPPTVITGTVDGTTLTFDPMPAGAKATIGKGESVEVHSSVPFVVKSQDMSHPLYVMTYMTGGAAFGGAGDPDFTPVLPAAQYLNRYLFFTDPTYPETNLVFVRTKAKDGLFHDVTLDCAGVVGGWAAVGASGDYQFTHLDLSRHNYAGQGSCDNGVHEAHSEGPFSITVWGWGTSETGDVQSPGYSQLVSYAYPVGASAQPINNVVVMPK